ncbi:MAG TPA: MlaD family protein [Mariprofundaceae bacterium]|nr:MlaD family protein [Mariprofundaceae bacterium]
MNQQARLGAFVLIALILFGFAATRIGDVAWVKQDVNVVETEFDDLMGLDIQSPVRMAGVKIGIVQEILLRNNRAVVRIALNPDIRLPASTYATIVGRGLVGEKNLALVAKPGDTDWLPEGAVIPSQPAGDINTFMAQASGITEDIRKLSSLLTEMFSGEDQTGSLKSILAKTNQAVEELSSMIKENRTDLHSTIHNLSKTSALLNKELPSTLKALSEVSQELPSTVAVGKDFFENSNATIVDNRENLYRMLFELRKAAENLEVLSDDLKRNPWKLMTEKPEIPPSKRDREAKMEELLLTTGKMGATSASH